MTSPKTALYHDLLQQAQSLVAATTDPIANAANIAALLWYGVPDLNWAGFYFVKEPAGDLVLGPFHGRPACVWIAAGKGVCGTAAASAKTLIVADVHAFAGHIACDAASNSEIVVPLQRYHMRWTILSPKNPTATAMDGLAGWHRLYKDQWAVVHVKNDARY